MASLDAKRFELAVYVEPGRKLAVQDLLEADNDNCLLLDIERLIGMHIDAACEGDATSAENLRQFRRYASRADYGAGIAEVYFEAP